MSEAKSSKPWYKKWWGAILAILIWPFFLTWFVWKRANWNKGVKVVATAIIGAVAISSVVALAAISPPTIDLKSSTAAIKGSQYELVADIYPYNATVTVNGKQVGIDNQGKLDTTLSLAEGNDQITIVATDKQGTTQQTINVHRYTKAELAAQAQQAANAKAAAEKAAKAAADKKAASAKAAASKSQPTQTKNAGPTTAQQITAWYNSYGSSITALTNDFDQMSQDGTDSTAIEDTCTQIFDDATKAEGEPAIPDSATENYWAGALDSYVNGAQECQYGVNDSSVSEINQATTDFDQGNTQLTEASNAIKQIQQ